MIHCMLQIHLINQTCHLKSNFFFFNVLLGTFSWKNFFFFIFTWYLQSIQRTISKLDKSIKETWVIWRKKPPSDDTTYFVYSLGGRIWTRIQAFSRSRHQLRLRRLTGLPGIEGTARFFIRGLGWFSNLLW